MKIAVQWSTWEEFEAILDYHIDKGNLPHYKYSGSKRLYRDKSFYMSNYDYYKKANDRCIGLNVVHFAPSHLLQDYAIISFEEFKNKHINNMEKSFKINPPEGYEVDKEKSTIEEIFFKKIVKDKLPNSWDEAIKKGIDVRYGCGAIGGNGISHSDKTPLDSSCCPIHWKTKQQAEAWLALYKLIHLRDIYRGEWKPDYAGDSRKYVISFEEEEIDCSFRMHCQEVLSFQSEEVRDKFLKNFKNLIEQAKDLL